MPDRKAESPRPFGKKGAEKSSEGVLRQLADFFTGADPEKEKRRELKAVARALRKVNNKLYNPKSEQALPGLAKLFFEFYRALGPAQSILAHAKSSNVLRSILIESGLNKEQAALKERLSEPSIRERLAKGMGQDTVEEIKADIKALASIFDAARTSQLNEQYKSLSVLLNLVHFDYYMLLRKFDPQLREGDFLRAPRFEATNAQYIADELKDFLEILPAFDPLEDWNTLWGILKAYRGAEPVAPEAWKRLLSLIRRLRKTGELEMAAQLITGNPYYRPNPQIYRGNVVEEYLAKLKAETENTLLKVTQEKRTQSIEALSRQVFGSSAVSRLAHYTEEANRQYVRNLQGGYALVAPLNYLCAFLTDFVKKDLNQAVEALLIRGKWSDNTQSQILSESYHQLGAIAEELEHFDASLAPESELGRRLVGLASHADKDRRRVYIARKLLNKVNEQARSLIMRSGQHCVSIGKMLKQVVEEVSRGKPQLILNWAEIAGRSTPRGLKDSLLASYRKLYYFVQLMKLYI